LRSDRVSDELRDVLANIFIAELHIPESGLLTVTRVKVSDDIKIAKIYISFLNNKISIEELIQIVISKRKLIRHFVSKKINLKYIPELRFYYDDTYENAEKINKLINRIHCND
tara:strand:- start:1227 stop:1565 length:339 start_codon:yes stop_codon:yes gene_type:complete